MGNYSVVDFLVFGVVDGVSRDNVVWVYDGIVE